MATEYLIRLGHRRIDFLANRMDGPFRFTPGRDRYRGYKQAMQQAGIPARPLLTAGSGHSRYEARRIVGEMVGGDDPPTAICAASDTRAMGALEALADLDVAVPGDISVIGYDDIQVAEYLGLSTIRQPLYESGLRGVEMLLQELQGHSPAPLHASLPLTLVQRRTSGPPAL
jgi:DNA-binding LacI/PurR family transcriptional regulator